MKQHKTMNQNLLIPIIIQQLTSHFSPDVSVIKVTIFSYYFDQLNKKKFSFLGLHQYSDQERIS
jgi:hypothetical protein